MADTTDRIDEIVAAAQRTAEQIRRDAEQEAEQYLAERRREAGRLVAAKRAGAQQAFDAFCAELSRIATAADQPEAELAEVAALHEAGDPAADGADPESDRGTALVRAGQLAAIGRSWEEIEETLRTELGIEDPSEIIEQILAPGEAGAGSAGARPG